MNAPQTLTERRQWVLWRAENGTKVPYQIGGRRRASSTDPRTWAPFHDVLRELKRHPDRYSGPGYVFSGDDELTGIDLDDCRNPESGMIDDWARAILDSLNSYAEVSPSGCGVKVWAIGTLAESVKTAQVEIYPRARYFAFTGQRLAEYPDEPQPAQDALDALAEHYGRRDAEPAAYATLPPSADSHRERWARRVLGSAVAKTIAALDGEKHNELLGAARLAAGAMPYVAEDEIERTLYDAIRGRAADPRAALKTIRDGIRMGALRPLDPPPAPTTQALVVKDGRPWCPDCGVEVRRSKYPYPDTDEPGWYCPDCKGAMKWPASSFTPAEKAGPPPADKTPPTEYRPAFPTPESAGKVHDDKPPRPRIFLPHIFQAGLALVVGSPGVGKTPLLIQLAVAFATGSPWLGTMPCPKLRTLYIGVEYDRAYVNDVLTESCGGRPPDELDILTVEKFTPPATEEEAHEMVRFYFEVLGYDVIIMDTLSGFLPAEKFKQDRYRGDYREFLAYHRLALQGQRLLVGAWHDTKTVLSIDKAFNGSQGLWGSAGGGRVNLYRDEQEDVRLRAQLRGKPRKEWALAEAWIGKAHIWSTVDGDPEPIFGSEVQRAIYRIIKTEATRAEPLTPKAIHAIHLNESPDSNVKIEYVRKMLAVLKGRGLIVDVGGQGYIVDRSGASGTDGYGVVREDRVVRSGTELFGSEQLRTNDGTETGSEWYGHSPHQVALNRPPYQSVPSDPRVPTDPDDLPLDDPAPTAAEALAERLRQRKGG